MPDGIFSDQNTNIGIFLKPLRWKMLVYFVLFGIFIIILVYFMTIWYVCGHFGTLFPTLFLCTKKNLATLPETDVTIFKVLLPKI
jgi:hypothetical protein